MGALDVQKAIAVKYRSTLCLQNTAADAVLAVQCLMQKS